MKTYHVKIRSEMVHHIKVRAASRKSAITKASHLAIEEGVCCLKDDSSCNDTFDAHVIEPEKKSKTIGKLKALMKAIKNDVQKKNTKTKKTKR